MDTHVATHELVKSRHIPAPPAAVFAAWLEPARLKAWWAPHGVTTPEARVNLRPGGFHRTLLLDTTGPAMSGEGTARYRDIVTLDDDDTRILASEVEGPGGAMLRFMTARYRRMD